jgi:acyl-CoA synthetase (AMP-forming)/AMP-acid ligase II
MLSLSSATLKYNLKSLAMLYSGAAPLSSHLLSAVRQKLHSVGANVTISQGYSLCNRHSFVNSLAHTGYGLTECSPVATILPPKYALDKVGSVGLLMPNMEARIVMEPEDGTGPITDVQQGEPGELWLRGPNIMKVSRIHFLHSSLLEFVISGVLEQHRGNAKFHHT